jgi:hypothetical protein
MINAKFGTPQAIFYSESNAQVHRRQPVAETATLDNPDTGSHLRATE